MDDSMEKVMAVLVWLGLMAAMVVACTLPVWTK
jgi:hypothetical protein